MALPSRSGPRQRVLTFTLTGNLLSIRQLSDACLATGGLDEIAVDASGHFFLGAFTPDRLRNELRPELPVAGSRLQGMLDRKPTKSVSRPVVHSRRTAMAGPNPGTR